MESAAYREGLAKAIAAELEPKIREIVRGELAEHAPEPFSYAQLVHGTPTAPHEPLAYWNRDVGPLEEALQTPTEQLQPRSIFDPPNWACDKPLTDATRKSLFPTIGERIKRFCGMA